MSDAPSSESPTPEPSSRPTPPPPRSETETVPTTTTAPRRSVRDVATSSWLWPVLNLLGIFGIALTRYLSETLPLNDVSASSLRVEDAVPYRPPEWMEVLWWVVLLVMFVYVISGLLPGARKWIPTGLIGPVLFASSIAHIVWIFLEHWRQHEGALIAIAVVLVALLICFLAHRTHNAADHGGRSSLMRTLAAAPLTLYLSWMTVAFFIGVQIWMLHGGWRGPFGLNAWTVVFMLLSLMIAAVFAFFAKDPAYPAMQVLALMGIAQRSWDSELWLALVAIMLVILMAVLTAMAFILAVEPARSVTAPVEAGRRRGRLNFFNRRAAE